MERSVRLFRACLFAVASLRPVSASIAQPKAPVGRFVVDIRGASAGLPTPPGWTPDVPRETGLPSRALGFEVGAHIYVVRFPGAALGVGTTWLITRGKTAPPEVPVGTTPPTLAGAEVSTRLSSLVPQLSLNFGHSLGWSYLSAGLGRTRVHSDATALTPIAQFTSHGSDWTKTLNFGGGARWFITDHLGWGFDLRWHKVSIVPGSLTHPGAPRASLVAAGAGISIK